MRNRAPLLLTTEDLPRYARPDRRLELVDGHLFVSSLDTPYLAMAIARVAAAVEDAGGAADGRRVLVNEPFPMDERNVLIPDVSVIGKGPSPQLVVEVRSDSSPRYALGPKRMVYARVGVLEYWYVDPRAGTVSVLRRPKDHMDFIWPPEKCTGDDLIKSGVVLGEVHARDLLL